MKGLKQTSVRLKNDTYKKLLLISEDEDRSVSNLINLYLEKVLNDKEKKLSKA